MPEPGTRRRLIGVTWPVVALVFGIYALLTWAVVSIPAPASRAAAGALSHVVLTAAALFFNLRRARQYPDESAGWRLLAAAGAVVIVFEGALAVESAAPGLLAIPPAAWLFQTVAANGALFAGLLLLPFGPRTAQGRLRTGLDGVSFATAAFLLLWISGLRSELAGSTAAPLVHAEALFSYGANAAALGIVVYLGARSHQRFGGVLGWFALATLALSCGTALVLYGRLHGTFQLGGFAELLQLAAYPCFILAPLVQTRTADGVREDGGSLLGDTIIYAPVVLAVALGVRATVSAPPVDPVLQLGVPLLAGFVLTRQALALRDVRELSATLEVRVTERTLELQRSQQALVSAQRMEAIGRVAGGVAHDFNNVLTVVRSAAELLGDGLPVGHPSRGDLEAILGAAQSGSSLARELLAFAGGPAAAAPDGRPPEALGDAHEAVHALAWLTRTLAVGRIEYRERLEATVARVTAPGLHLEQLLSNLIGNARDAMPEGGVLTVTTAGVTLDDNALPARGAARAGDYLRLSVADSGSGIPSDLLSEVFEPFVTTKEPGKGTGLGLATCYAIARDAGGFIAVDSSPGGTRFDVFLPVRR
jgi:signal transduction histidine kinase